MLKGDMFLPLDMPRSCQCAHVPTCEASGVTLRLMYVRPVARLSLRDALFLFPFRLQSSVRDGRSEIFVLYGYSFCMSTHTGHVDMGVLEWHMTVRLELRSAPPQSKK